MEAPDLGSSTRCSKVGSATDELDEPLKKKMESCGTLCQYFLCSVSALAGVLEAEAGISKTHE